MSKKLKHPKELIIEHYDDLIRRIDIYTEKLLLNYNENDQLPNCDANTNHLDIESADFEQIYGVEVYKGAYNNNYKYKEVDMLTKTGRVVDYINRVRERAIEALKRAQDENLRL